MTELDSFEQQFARAYREHLDEVDPRVDATAVAHAIALRHRAPGWSAGHPLLAAPGLRPAFILLLAVALLAVIGGMFVAGMRPSVPTTSCPAGTHPDVPGSVDQSRPDPKEIVTGLAFDPARMAVVYPDEAGTWAFDVCRNAWARLGEPPADRYASLAYDADAASMVAIDTFGGAWTFDATTGRWIAHRPAPWVVPGSPDAYTRARLVYDDASGDVLAAWLNPAHLELWALDVETDRWGPILSGPPPWEPATDGFPAYDPLMAWDAAADRLIVLYTAQRNPDHELVADTWIFDPARATWSRGAEAPVLAYGWLTSGAEITYADSIAETIVIGRGTAIAYDASGDRWRVLSGAEFLQEDAPGLSGPTARFYQGLAYDAANRRIVMIGGSTGEVTTDVWAFVPSDGSWIELLAPARH